MMKSNTKLKLAGAMLGAALTTTTAIAGNGGACGAGKCGADTKKIEKKGACGSGKCGGDMQKEMKKSMKGSCGAGKCGGDMRSNDMKNDMQNSSMRKDKKVTGSCGAGKCGSN